MRLLPVRPWVVVCIVASLLVVAAGAPGLPVAAAAGQQQAAEIKELPNRPDSLKFAVIGDNGTGATPQYEVAKQMLTWHEKFPFVLVVMMGDNIYGSDRPQDFVKKFEAPYKPLLDAGVKFYASLGNHDSPEQRLYKFYNMDGKRYYSSRRRNRTSGSSRSRARTWIRTSSGGWRKSSKGRVKTGRSPSSITRCIRPPGPTDRS